MNSGNFMKIRFLLLLLAPVLVAQAAVTIRFNADSLRDDSGLAVSTSALGLIVADTTGNGFGQLSVGSISVGSFIGSSDLVVFRADFTSAGTPGVFSSTASNVNLFGDWGAGDQLAFIWIPTFTTVSTNLSAGVRYGLVTDSAWLTPSDGGLSPVFQVISTTSNGFFSLNATTLSISDVQSRASLSVIPEPSTFVLFTGLGVIGFVATRRRRALS